LNNNTDGSGNTAVGVAALINNFGGGLNVAVGASALFSNNSGSSNTGLGAGANVSFAGLSYATSLGADAFVNASDKVRLGDAFVSVVEGPVAYSVASDARFKRQVKEDVKGLDFIRELRPVTYTFEASKYKEHVSPDNQSDKEQTDEQKSLERTRAEKADKALHTGFLAQEVEEAAQKVGYEKFDGVIAPQNDHDIYSLRYSLFVVPLVKAVQELDEEDEAVKEEVQALEEEVYDLQMENEDLKTRLEALEQMVQQLAQQNAGNGSSQTITLTSAKLEQNEPNPFSVNTIIRYFIPEGVNRAELRITDADGSLIKTIVINEAGHGRTQVQANTLSAGTYAYSLVLDGQIIETKQMILTR
jgi:regulator of replication initiation timing